MTSERKIALPAGANAVSTGAERPCGGSDRRREASFVQESVRRQRPCRPNEGLVSSRRRRVALAVASVLALVVSSGLIVRKFTKGESEQRPMPTLDALDRQFEEEESWPVYPCAIYPLIRCSQSPEEPDAGDFLDAESSLLLD